MLRVPYSDPRINLWSLPAALLAVAISKLIVFPDGVFWYFFTIPVHEMGHTITAWLGSRIALPLGAMIPMAGQTLIFPDRSILVYLVFSAALIWMVTASWRQERVGSLLFSSVVLVLLNYVTWRIPHDQLELAITYFGVGGEFVLSTLLILSFYYPMPDQLRWDFFRFVFLFIGTYCFVSVFQQWMKFSANPGSIPWGSFLNGSGDSGGDMARLRDVHKWSPREIVQSYLGLGWKCSALIVAHYLFFLIRKPAPESGDGSH